MAEQDLASKLNTVREQVRENERLRAQAEAKLDAVKERAAQIDEQIKALGVDPAKAEDTLTKLEAQLAKDLDELQAAIEAESAAHRQILAVR